MASGIAGAATRSVLTGTDFGDNLIAVLPDVIGSTLGRMASEGISGPSRLTGEAREELLQNARLVDSLKSLAPLLEPTITAGDDIVVAGSMEFARQHAKALELLYSGAEEHIAPAEVLDNTLLTASRRASAFHVAGS